MYWEQILSEVLNKDYPFGFYGFIPRKIVKSGAKQKKMTGKRKEDMKIYALGTNYPHLYLTQREAECMLNLINGRTISATATALALSSRTVEFYVNNMKKKLDCRTKSDLIEKILKTDFMRYVDFSV